VLGEVLMADEARTVRSDATTTVFFGLEVDSVLQAAFSDLALVSEIKPVEVTEGTGDTVILGQRIRPHVALKRRQNDDMRLFAWHESVVDGPIPAARKDCTITVFDASGAPLARYHLEKAWPFRIEVGPLTASPSEDLLETVTLICDNVRRVAL
jgi:phage tail-like protein